MAKPPRPSIADQIAAVAATRPRENVTTAQRERVEESEPLRDIEATSKPELETSSQAPSRDVETTSSRGPVSTRKRGNETADGMKVRQRIEKPHASLYAHPRVFKKLREIAAAEDCKPHDLYVEGLRMVLARYGYDLDRLEKGEA
jgi:hypothetical protein